MKHRILLLTILVISFLSYTSHAQNPTPHWAVKIDGTDISPNFTSGDVLDIATDKLGNSYALVAEAGTIDADGNTTPRNDAQMVLASWDCNGTFRWMKALGGNAVFRYAYVEVDTLGGVYLSGVTQYAGPNDSAYWDVDTSIINPPGQRVQYIMKYNNLGHYTWFKATAYNLPYAYQQGFSATPTGDIYWFAILDPGVYDNSFTIATRGYYAVKYNAQGNYQSVAPLAISLLPSGAIPLMTLQHDPVTKRFYATVELTSLNNGMMIGNTPLAAAANPQNMTVAVLAAFNAQGNNIWVRQASTNKSSTLTAPAFGEDGRIYLGINSEPGVLFMGDTTKNAYGSYSGPGLMALDTNADLLWSEYGGSMKGDVGSVSYANNTLAAAGAHQFHIKWGTTVIRGNFEYQGYLVRANATTGALISVDSIQSAYRSRAEVCCMNRNGDVYVGGIFGGFMQFANDTFSSTVPTPAWHFDEYVAKYANVVCNCNLLKPSFSWATPMSATYQFNYNGATPYTGISWDFGDGNVATGTASPMHTYTGSGTYPVCVTVTNNCGSNTTCQYITISITDVKDVNAFSAASIYPNPAHDEVIVDNLEKGTAVEIFDVMGRRIHHTTAMGQLTRINVADMANGMYMIRFTDKKGNFGSRSFTKE